MARTDRCVKLGGGRRRVALSRGTFGSWTLIFIFASLFPVGLLGLLLMMDDEPSILIFPAVMVAVAAWAGWNFIKRIRQRVEITLESISYCNAWTTRSVRWADLLWIRNWPSSGYQVIVLVSQHGSLRLRLSHRMGRFVVRACRRFAPSALLGDEANGLVYSRTRSLTPEQVHALTRLRKSMLLRGILQTVLAGSISGLFVIVAGFSILTHKGGQPMVILTAFCLGMSLIFWLAAARGVQRIRNLLS